MAKHNLCVTATAALVAVLALLFGLVLLNIPAEGPPSVNLGALKQTAPTRGAPGRYAEAPADAVALVQGDGLSNAVLKRWHYLSINTPRLYVGMLVADIRYVADGFVYIVNKEAPGGPTKYEYASLSPLALAAKSNSTGPLAGCTAWRSGDASFSACAERSQKQQQQQQGEQSDATGLNYRILADVPVQSASGTTVRATINVTLAIPEKEGLSLLYPLGEKRFAFTHKMTGFPAAGVIRLGSMEETAPVMESSNWRGASDWTVSMARRVTKWKWASLSHVTEDGTTLGINFSADVYDDTDGASQENAIWVNGHLFLVGKVAFEVPERSKQGVEPWRLRTVNPSEDVQVDLVFAPVGSRSDDINFGLIVTNFVQAFGKFNGEIRVGQEQPIKIVNGFGVCEDHYAKW